MLTLTDGDLEARFVPEAGMIGCSLRHRGAEVLGQRGGLDAYVAERKTMGIPLLFPWANRLSSTDFELLGRAVHIDTALTRLDGGGLPMHGLLAAARGWEVEAHSETSLAATFAFTGEPWLESFPFPQRLRFEVSLAAPTLSIALAVSADEPVPIAFGFHPYLQLPDVPRAEWVAEIPVSERLVLDERMLPTGERVPVDIARGPLGDRTYDDAFTAPSAPFALEGGGRRIELAFEDGYPFSQVFAPPTDDLIAFEPMTAPTNALVSGSSLLFSESYRAAFSISVS